MGSTTEEGKQPHTHGQRKSTTMEVKEWVSECASAAKEERRPALSFSFSSSPLFASGKRRLGSGGGVRVEVEVENRECMEEGSKKGREEPERADESSDGCEGRCRCDEEEEDENESYKKRCRRE